ncbi:hypothetical protein NDU88_004116 [Pleurodeles waltl]|uniref:ribonuclease H n=1 Tax=Pleurodeles waltl TaxID=8319 RepID=A0AAV7VHR7_PLEWA|nr:hypothetical protein NDU88_004116 [Pleurodeles waltl]
MVSVARPVCTVPLSPYLTKARHRALGPARHHRPSVAFLTETWWNDSSAPDIAIAIPDGYKITRRDPTNGIGGGIAIVHKTTLKIHTHTDNTLKTAEHLHFRIHTDPNTTLRGTLIYQPPGPRAPFSDTIADLASTHALASTDYILLGDLNFHLENNNDANTASLTLNLSNLGLRQLVNTPTHIAGHTLDRVFSTSSHVTFSHTSELHWTDHHCVHFTFKKHTEHHRTPLPPHRRWSKVSEDQLTSTLAQNPPIDPTDPDTAAVNLHQWILNCANTLAPLKRPTVNQEKKKAAWFTDKLITSKRTCQKLKKKWLLERTPDSLQTHKEATRKHHHLIRLAKRSHFTERLNNNAHDSKELFCIVKELSNPSANVNDVPPSQKLCDALSTFFYQKIAVIHDSLNTTPPPDPTPDNSACANRLTTWTHVNDSETRKIMNSIHSGSPSDPCPHHVYNKANSTIAPQLRKIINLSFETATFPDSWKHADIQTLLKKPKADPNDLKNFRPISLLPFPAKVIEKIVNTQLTHYLEDNSILDTSQSGFRRNHSTETALLAAKDDIRQQMDNSETSALILLDLSAAFDTVCHRTLLTCLHEAGIQDKALNWISSFLSGRTQRVRLSPFRSEATNLICGVPQGSSLSPTLFNVYMAPLAQLARQHNLSILSYTDDTQLILSLTKDPHTTKANLHEGLKSIAEWMRISRLKLNSDKTEVLILGRTPSACDDSWWPTTLGPPPQHQPTTHATSASSSTPPSPCPNRSTQSHPPATTPSAYSVESTNGSQWKPEKL